MIYRFSSDNNYDLIMQKMLHGEQVNYDQLWTKEARDERGAQINTDALLLPVRNADDVFYLVSAGMMTAGVWPVVDTIIYGLRKNAKRHVDRLDSKVDIIAVSADEVLFFADKIKAKVSELVKQGHKVSVAIDGCAQTEKLKEDQRIEYNFDTQKLLKLFDLQYELQQLGMTGSLKFNEFFQTTKYSDLKSCWSLEQVIKANNEIDKVVEKIQDLKLSPYETMVYIHKYLTQNYEYGLNVSRKYDQIDARKSEKNRSIIAAIKKKKTICSGYASLTKAIIDRLNMPGLECEYQVVSCWVPTDRDYPAFVGGHALTHVTIEDPKYDIKGSYLNDATWDAKNMHHPHGCGYTYFMYPVADSTKLRPEFFSDSPDGSRKRNGVRDYNLHVSPKSQYGSVPIPYETFEKAVKQVYSLESDFCHGKEPEQAATEDIQSTLKQAWHSRTDDANPLVKHVDAVYNVNLKYNRKHRVKNVQFELKTASPKTNKEKLL